MIAELLLHLCGHSSSIFTPTKPPAINPVYIPLLHPGEVQTLTSLALIASRYSRVKQYTLQRRSKTRYETALLASLSEILKDEYEVLVVSTEAQILSQDSTLVGKRGSAVPISALRAIFAEWDAPLHALENLIDELEEREKWDPGPLIDMLQFRASTGVHRVADIFSRLSQALQRVWRTQVIVFLVHGNIATIEPLASPTYELLEGSMPSCVSDQSRESIAYVGRAIGTVRSNRWKTQLPRELGTQHTRLLEDLLPQDQHGFDAVISQIRTNISEWLWLNVLTQKDVETAVESLADYFCQRNGEFSLSLIREIERLKISRLTTRSGATSMIREQDLNVALLRASLGTSAQYDPSLSLLHFTLPSGPLRPLLPSLSRTNISMNISASMEKTAQFDDFFLGTRLSLTYKVTWPLDLFLSPVALQTYTSIFSYLSALRRTHTLIHTCWASLSNAQRSRRQWTGLGEGGKERERLLRCGWSVVRDMGWFLDTLLSYIMTDVVDVEYKRLRRLISADKFASHGDGHANSSYLDFSSLRNLHTSYLERLFTGSLLSNPPLTNIIRNVFEVCERFVAQVERWGGDVLPALLFEGSIGGEEGQEVGVMVRERSGVISEINEVKLLLFGVVISEAHPVGQNLSELLQSFYDQLTLSTSQQFLPGVNADVSISIARSRSMIKPNTSTLVRKQGTKVLEGETEVRRHVERLLLRLDFNGRFSTWFSRPIASEKILAGL